MKEAGKRRLLAIHLSETDSRNIESKAQLRTTNQ